MFKEGTKWIHLQDLGSNRPQISIEGLTNFEALLWLKEAERFIVEKNKRETGDSELVLKEYLERQS